jgi:hypothetical protein
MGSRISTAVIGLEDNALACTQGQFTQTLNDVSLLRRFCP